MTDTAEMTQAGTSGEPIISAATEKLVMQVTDRLSELDMEAAGSRQEEGDRDVFADVDPLDYTGADGKIRTFWLVTEEGEIEWDEEKADRVRQECAEQRSKVIGSPDHQ